MAVLFNVERVQYKCSCGLWNPLCKQYFCRHCVVLRCGFCVSHEVDSIYCPQCLENMPSAEARLKKNKCCNCFECPICRHSLSTRATSLKNHVTQSGQDSGCAGSGTDAAQEGGPPKKVYYLFCSFCRWTSRESSIPDQSSASGSWPEKSNPYEQLLLNVQETFQSMALVEKAERERKRFTSKRRAYLPWTDKYGISAIMSKKRMAYNNVRMGGTKNDSGDESGQENKMEPSEEVEALPEDLLTSPLVLDSISTVKQRHTQPEFQPEHVKDLYPVRKQLIIKRSQRCKECDHNLCKAEYSPNSIKFKIQLTATYHVPEFRIMKPAVISLNKETEIFLTLANLSSSMTHVVLVPDLTHEGPDIVKAEMSPSQIVLPVRDEPAELDDSAEMNSNFQDDPELVMERKGHKVWIKMSVLQEKETSRDLWVHFIIKYDYINTLLSLTGEQKEPEVIWMQQHVKVNLGKLSQPE